MRNSKDFSKAKNTKSRVSSEVKKRLLADAEQKVQKAENPMEVDITTLSKEQTESIIHDLRVHQIELKMQNDELTDLHRELEILKERYFNLYDMAPEGYLIISKKGSIIETNLTAVGILGLTKSEMLNKKVEDFIFHDDQDIYYHQCNLLHGNMNPPACELRMVRKDGALIWARLKATVEEDFANASCLIIMSDITLRKNAEVDLLKSEKKYKALFTNMAQGLALCEVITDDSGKFIDGLCIEANKSFIKLFKSSKKRVTGRRITEIIVGDQEYWLDIFKKVVQTGESNYTEYYFDNLDRYYGIYTYKPENDRFAIIVTDLAENIKRETEIT
jgi:PAS domain S-box-containing protein